MFTGIVQAKARAIDVIRLPGLARFAIEAPPGFCARLLRGASVAVDGVCLTVTEVDGHVMRFDAMAETLRATTLGELTQGRAVNVERSATLGDEIGGHVVSGHVSGTAEIVSVATPENNRVVTFRLPPPLARYVFSKGFVALDGVSLTVVDARRDAATFDVWLIPETLRATTFGDKGVGDRVNVEIDARTQAIVDTVEALLPDLLARAGRP
jgi:riboflavin synthase